MKIEKHNLLPKQKHRKIGLVVDIDLYALASELYEELLAKGIIDQVKRIPQLGVIKVPQKLKKTRYDYIMLQLYFHQLVKKELQTALRFTYNNNVRANQFSSKAERLPDGNDPTIGDILQILTITYNIGHFYNTFTASRAAIMFAETNEEFKEKVLCSSEKPRFHEAAKRIFEAFDYQRYHLLNSLLILEHCDQSKAAIVLAQNVIYAYLNPDELPEDSKLHYVFDLFRNVRNVSFVAYDLQIANTPFTLDLWNEKAVLVLFQELLSNYNDRLPAYALMRSMEKMLDDTVYNENSNAICYYKISRRMQSLMSENVDCAQLRYYDECFLNPRSYFNNTYRQTRDYNENNILKLTFSNEDVSISRELLLEVERINNSRVGYYDRKTGDRTILISIKKRCPNKKHTALRIAKIVISHLRRTSNIDCADPRFLLVAKFFLFYLFDENYVVIKPTVDTNKCVLCTRGKQRRIAELDRLLKKCYGTAGARHEVQFMRDRLLNDKTNDTSILIPASILLYQPSNPGKTFCEYDGLVIHPYRKEGQVLFLEAKDTKKAEQFAKRCLKEKFIKTGISFNETEILILNHDAYYELSL